MGKNLMDIVMWFFILLVVIAALRRPKAFATDVASVGNTASNFGGTILSSSGGAQ